MKVKLGLRVKGTDDAVFIERIVDLPFAPWVGLQISQLTNECSEMCEHIVEDVWWDAAEECFKVRLEEDDSDDRRTSQEIVDTDYSTEWIQEP